MNSLALVILLISVHLVSCQRNGASSASCESMVPDYSDGGPIPGQEGKSPFVLNATWDSNLKMVRLFVGGKAVEGFLIQGRFSENGPAVGRFVNITDDAKYQDCSSVKFPPQSSLTHTNPKDKMNLLFYWEPPRDMNKTENVTFYATLAQTSEVFWVKQESNSLNLNVMEGDDKGRMSTVIPSVNTTTKPEVNTIMVNTDGNTTNTSQTANTTDKVTTDTTTGPTDRGSNTASLQGLSLLTIWLIITIHVSL